MHVNNTNNNSICDSLMCGRCGLVTVCQRVKNHITSTAVFRQNQPLLADFDVF